MNARHSGTTVIGVDPGPTPGIVRLRYSPGLVLEDADVVQCSATAFYDVLLALGPYSAHVCVERFVVSRRSMSSRTAGAGEVTRDQVGALQTAYSATLRTAAAVKPWATDARLDAAGLLEACKGMRHARDAARHALFAAVRDHGVPDPLSRRSQ